jgi:hypothetical protein
MGAAGAAQLRRVGFLTLVMLPTVLACVVAFSLLAGKHLGLAVVAAIIGVAVWLVWFRARVRLASELSRGFGVPIRWWQLPAMRPAQFDAWCQRRGIEPRWSRNETE